MRNFTTIPNPSSTDYADVHSGNGVTVALTTSAPTAQNNLNDLIDGTFQQNNNDAGRSIFFHALPDQILMNLNGSVNITQFNSYSWHTDTRQNQVYDLYSSNAATAPNSGDSFTSPALLEGAGWSLLGSADTTYSTATPGQIGVSFAGSSGGTIATARYLLVSIHEGTGENSFLGEFDVNASAVAAPEPSSFLLAALSAVPLFLLRRRRA